MISGRYITKARAAYVFPNLLVYLPVVTVEKKVLIYTIKKREVEEGTLSGKIMYPKRRGKLYFSYALDSSRPRKKRLKGVSS